MNALIIYHTISGHTRRAAEDVASGLVEGGAAPRIAAVADLGELDPAGFDILVIGSPCHAGSLAIRAGVCGPVLGVLKRVQAATLAGVVGGAFAVHSSYGGHRTVAAIEKALRAGGAEVPEPGVVVTAGVPFSLFAGPMASDAARHELRELGRSLAEAATRENADAD